MEEIRSEVCQPLSCGKFLENTMCFNLVQIEFDGMWLEYTRAQL